MTHRGGERLSIVANSGLYLVHSMPRHDLNLSQIPPLQAEMGLF